MISKKLNIFKKLGLILSLSIITTIPALAASKTNPYVIYWGSWSSAAVEGIGEFPRSDTQNKVSKSVTQLNLSFVNIIKSGESYDVVSSDGFLNSSTATGWKNAPYNIWTGFKFHNPEVKILIAVGGATYPDIWTKTLTSQSADAIAKSLAKTVNTQYPTYHFNPDYTTKLIGNVTLDGVDLDVEGDENGLTETQAHNVALLITKLREYLPADKLITLTTFSTAADPITCKTVATPDCSYPYSAHSGEIIPVLTAVGKKIDYLNNMAYDAGKNYNYQVSNNNFHKYISADKLLLGLDLTNQWSLEGRFLETIDELKKRAGWVKANPDKVGGVFVWGIVGSSSAPSYPVNGPNGQLDIIAQIADQS